MVFKLIRSVFGIDRSDAGTDVPVEQDEQDTAAAGTDASGSVADTRVESAGAAEPAGAAGAASTERADPDVETPEEAAAAGTDAAASTGSLTEEPPADAAAAEPAEAAGPTDEDDEGGIPVEEVSGIGPAYAQRLNDTGIESVGDLLAADPEDVAASTDLSPKRISRWQDAAGDG